MSAYHPVVHVTAGELRAVKARGIPDDVPDHAYVRRAAIALGDVAINRNKVLETRGVLECSFELVLLEEWTVDHICKEHLTIQSTPGVVPVVWACRRCAHLYMIDQGKLRPIGPPEKANPG